MVLLSIAVWMYFFFVEEDDTLVVSLCTKFVIYSSLHFKMINMVGWINFTIYLCHMRLLIMKFSDIIN